MSLHFCLITWFAFGLCIYLDFVDTHGSLPCMLSQLSVLVACKVMALWQLTFSGFYDFFAEGSPPGNIPVTRCRFPEAE